MRRRRFSRLGLLFALALAGILVGTSVWLDRNGERVLAPVEAKHERVTLRRDPQGGWYRWYELGVGVGRHGTVPWTATVEVSEHRFDSIRLGDSIEVRYLTQLPLYARASDRTTATVAREAVQRTRIAPLVLWLLGGVAGLWMAARIGTIALIGVGLAWAAAGFPVFLQAGSSVIPSTAEATAKVTVINGVSKAPERTRSTRRMRRSGSQSFRRLAVPYQVVQLQLVRAKLGDTVLVVDAVDSGSVPGLALGAELTVRYDPAAPREARLVTGSRTFLDRNRYHYLPAVIVLPLIGVLAGLGFRWGRRRKSDSTPKVEANHVPHLA